MLENTLTIVIPCKNEGINIYDCVGMLCKQRGIAGTKIIIADNSDEEESIWWLWKTEADFKYSVKIEIIKGGYPAKARLEGSKLVKTPYILFLDSDIMLRNQFVIGECLAYDSDLVTTPFYTERGYNWIFRIFDVFQKISMRLKTPFAVGGFQLWKTETYWKCGGYIPEELFAEDYSISKKVDPEKFVVHKTKGIWTSARRFKNKGVFYMFWLMIKCYVNRNNPEFFKQHHNYWS
jgi:glycosyltransferase involved in cell wall biosynthesis